MSGFLVASDYVSEGEEEQREQHFRRQSKGGQQIMIDFSNQLSVEQFELRNQMQVINLTQDIYPLQMKKEVETVAKEELGDEELSKYVL